MTQVADPHDVQRVRRADGLLRTFNDAGVLGAADVHVAARLGRLGDEPDERVLLAAALTVRALRAGSVCLDVAQARATTAVEDVDAAALAALPWPEEPAWLSALEASPLVATGLDTGPDRGPDREPDTGPDTGPGTGCDAARPLRLRGSLLYLDRYWRQEQRIATVLDEAALRPGPEVDADRLPGAVHRLFPGEGPDRQRLAAVVVAHRWVSVLAGGPGTGKTTTVARLIAVLQDQAGGGLRVALAAPTAVAAKRLTTAAAAALAGVGEEDRRRVGTLEAVTLHRLLGRRPDSRTRFRHDRDNRLPHDVVVVDEASMVSLTLMSRLVDALRPDARLLLVGDPDQLASVEAGAVLGDLVLRDAPRGAPGLPAAGTATGGPGARDLADLDADERAAVLGRGVVRLSRVHRFAGDIAAFATAVRAGDPDAVREVLERGGDRVELVEVPDGSVPDGASLASLREQVVAAGTALHEAAAAGDGAEALRRLAAHQLLCGHRQGPFGVGQWTERVEGWLRAAVPGYAAEGRWYVGRPLLVTSNDYRLRLFNGDTGVVVAAGGRPRAAFLRDGVVDLLSPGRLADVTTLHAMSVHRSQGSQYDAVTLVLPPAGSPLLTRELLYTGATRAQHRLRVVGSRPALEAAVRRPVVRASGLRLRR